MGLKRVAVLTFLVLAGCGPKYDAIDYRVRSVTPMDTINMTDKNGVRQGKWVITTKDFHPSDSIYKGVEEGLYKDGKREGQWTIALYKLESVLTSTLIYKADTIFTKTELVRQGPINNKQ